jgi:predicted nucleic acid-binding protein
MARRNEIYADTSAWIAFLDRSDTYHVVFRRLFSAPPPIVTSALTIAEGHAWFLRRYDQQRAVQFLRFIDELGDLEIVAFDAAEISEVRRLVQKYGDQKLTLADAHGLAIMRERRIRLCWSTDRHLGLTGVQIVI